MRGPFIYQNDPKYRKDPEIPERPVNGSIHARVSGGRGSGRFILILKNVIMNIFEYSYNKKNIKIYCLMGLAYDTTNLMTNSLVKLSKMI